MQAPSASSTMSLQISDDMGVYMENEGYAREVQVQRPRESREGPSGRTVVQVKRKRSVEPIESLCGSVQPTGTARHCGLEVNVRPSKRHALDIKNLSLDATTDAPDDSAPTKLLFRRVESLSPSGVKDLSLPQLLEKAKERKRPRDVSDKREIKKFKNQDAGKIARFEQVRVSRRRKENIEEDDSGQEIFNLYEVVRVDVEAESAEKAARREKAKREAQLTEGQLLCNYLPLLREHLPDLAAEIDATVSASTSTTASTDVPTEEYVYDVYTLDEEMDDEDGDGAFYPTVQVFGHVYDRRETKDSDYDSEDSNDENNPNNDYPDEEDDLPGNLSDSSGYDLADYNDPYAQGHEEYDISISDDDKEMIWKPRK